jgi:pimeloyl-ACP methyl ester carboxylesterase
MRGQALNVARALADGLAARGIASLRYDKRGVGASGGDYRATGFEQETDDARVALAELPADRRFVIGHSVGALIAIRLAASEPLAGVVLLAGTCGRGDDVMRQQSERIAETMSRGGDRFLRRQARVREKLLATNGDVARFGLVRLPARWFREYMTYDPVPDIRAIRCPVLAITGRKDIQVDPEDVVRIGELVDTPFTGETPDDLTHLLRKSPDPPGLKAYRAQIKEPTDPELVDRVASWVASG